jgi:hypothetical protein
MVNWVTVVVTLLWDVIFGLPEAISQRVPENVLGFIVAAIFVVTVNMVYGAVKMMQLEARAMSLLAAFLAMFVIPGNIIGLPIGIWALVVLHRVEVREAFKSREAAWSFPAWLWKVLVAIRNSARYLSRLVPDRVWRFLGSNQNWALYLTLLGLATIVVPWAHSESTGHVWGFQWHSGTQSSYVVAGVSAGLLAVAFITAKLRSRPLLRSLLLLVGGVVITLQGRSFIVETEIETHEAIAKAKKATKTLERRLANGDPTGFKGSGEEKELRLLIERNKKGMSAPSVGPYVALICGLGLVFVGLKELCQRFAGRRSEKAVVQTGPPACP